MNQKELYNRLQSGEMVYLLDDFKEAVIRLYFDNGQTKAFIKHHGHNEIEISQSNETVCDIILGGKKISKSEYEKY